MTVATKQTWNPVQYSKMPALFQTLACRLLNYWRARGERILDLGCGDGPLTKKLADFGCRLSR